MRADLGSRIGGQVYRPLRSGKASGGLACQSSASVALPVELRAKSISQARTMERFSKCALPSNRKPEFARSPDRFRHRICTSVVIA